MNRWMNRWIDELDGWILEGRMEKEVQSERSGRHVEIAGPFLRGEKSVAGGGWWVGGRQVIEGSFGRVDALSFAFSSDVLLLRLVRWQTVKCQIPCAPCVCLFLSVSFSVCLSLPLSVFLGCYRFALW